MKAEPVREQNIEQRLYRLLGNDPAVSAEKVDAVKKAARFEWHARQMREGLSAPAFARAVLRTCGLRMVSMTLGTAVLVILLTKSILEYGPAEPYALHLYVKVISVLTAEVHLSFWHWSLQYGWKWPLPEIFWY